MAGFLGRANQLPTVGPAPAGPDPMWELAHQYARLSPTELIAMGEREELSFDAVVALLQMRGIDPGQFGLIGSQNSPFVPRNDIASYNVTGDIGEYGPPKPITPIGNSEQAGAVIGDPYAFPTHRPFAPVSPGPTPGLFRPDAVLDESQVDDRRRTWLPPDEPRPTPEQIAEKIKRAKRLTPPGSFVK